MGPNNSDTEIKWSISSKELTFAPLYNPYHKDPSPLTKHIHYYTMTINDFNQAICSLRPSDQPSFTNWITKQQTISEQANLPLTNHTENLCLLLLKLCKLAITKQKNTTIHLSQLTNDHWGNPPYNCTEPVPSDI